MNREFYKKVKEELNNNKNICIVTVIKDKEDKHLGKKILKIDDEILFEDEENIEFYNKIINKFNFNESGKTIKIDDDIEIIIENIISKPNLIICGGGHIALSLASMGKMLDFNTTVIDDREEFANEERFPEVDNVICDSFTNALERINFNKNSYFVVVTRGHRADQECVEKILKNKFRYLGMIGSKGKVAHSINKLLEKGYTTEDINKINAPIGISIGAKTPAEISVSIMAQIIQEKSNGNVSNIDEEILNDIIYSDNNKVLVSILHKRGSSPRGVDAKMLVKNDSSFIGTIGGGMVENVAYEKALDLIKDKKSHIESYDLSNSAAAKLGMACGGTIKVLFEYIE
ncbi:XdhC/CoxI family protein [uncultured Clostridium sp.]|uniref:XdhC family protein n=1 Tax=uncultured Clostridium sp. TaxID=59620 RepID=UPI0025E7F6EE|nr:XdhC/CoxI family protein [uncultured Clostridium sp.]MDU4882660.1 XdhC/CoxI family protein [Clostridium celatum]MDU7076072.1 XdhC/CoxI family protein [Clostridium celatum]